MLNKVGLRFREFSGGTSFFFGGLSKVSEVSIFGDVLKYVSVGLRQVNVAVFTEKTVDMGLEISNIGVCGELEQDVEMEIPILVSL